MHCDAFILFNGVAGKGTAAADLEAFSIVPTLINRPSRAENENSNTLLLPTPAVAALAKATLISLLFVDDESVIMLPTLVFQTADKLD